MNLGKAISFLVGMSILCVVAVTTLASFAPSAPFPRHLFEAALVVVFVCWAVALLIGMRRILWTGKLF